MGSIYLSNTISVSIQCNWTQLRQANVNHCRQSLYEIIMLKTIYKYLRVNDTSEYCNIGKEIFSHITVIIKRRRY